MGFGITESLIVLAIILLLFGAKKVPELGKAFGRSIGTFKEGLKEHQEEEELPPIDQSKKE